MIKYRINQISQILTKIIFFFCLENEVSASTPKPNQPFSIFSFLNLFSVFPNCLQSDGLLWIPLGIHCIVCILWKCVLLLAWYHAIDILRKGGSLWAIKNVQVSLVCPILANLILFLGYYTWISVLKIF